MEDWSITLVLLLISRLATVSTGWNTNSSATPVSQSAVTSVRSLEAAHRMHLSQGHAQCPTLCPLPSGRGTLFTQKRKEEGEEMRTARTRCMYFSMSQGA